MIAPLLALLALAGQQPAPADDGPLQTAPRERPASDDPIPGLDEKAVEIPPAAKPVDESKTAPAAVAAAKAVTVEPKTMVQGETLQLMLGQRAIFRVDDKGVPVLETVEDGRLAAAHPAGEVTETFAPPPEGQIAAALDGSAEARATILKIWNQTTKAVDYRAIALVMSQGKVAPVQAPVCAVPAGEVREVTWRRPVVAVGLGRFLPTETVKDCN